MCKPKFVREVVIMQNIKCVPEHVRNFAGYDS